MMQTLFERQTDKATYRVLWCTAEETAELGEPAGYYLDVAYADGGRYRVRVNHFEEGVRGVYDELRGRLW